MAAIGPLEDSSAAGRCCTGDIECEEQEAWEVGTVMLDNDQPNR